MLQAELAQVGVGGLHVPVDQALVVGLFEGLADLSD